MINVEISTVVERPVAEVFAFVADFENLPKWETDFQEVRLLSAAPGGVGTTYQCVLKMPGQGGVPSKFVITAYEAGKRIAFEGEPSGPAKPVGSFVFAPVASGTQITSLPRPQFSGIFKLLEPLMAGYIKKNNTAHLSHLKQLLEARP
jgi:uncharacterized membrane protein